MSLKFIFVFLILMISISYSQQFNNYDQHILSLSPLPNLTNADDSSSIIITFTKIIVNNISVSDFQISGSINGSYNCNFNYNAGDKSITLIPSEHFAAGEKVIVTSRYNLITSDNDTIKPFSWNFIVSPASGSGSFSIAYNKKLFELSGDFVTADINIDGLPDLINYNYSYGRVVIFKNSPDMNFSETMIQVGTTPACVAAADYNNDGLPDIAAVHASQSNSVTILKQNPDGSFDQTKLNNNFSAALVKNADVDNDGYIDLIFYSYTQSNAIYIYKNNGGMNFDFAVKIPMTNSSRDFELSDLDNDGDLDLVFSSFFEGRIYIFENKDSLQFSAAGFIQIQGEPLKTICADFNNDGLPDISVLDQYSRSVTFFQNTDSLNFLKASVSYFGSPTSFTHGDFDNDGDLDIAAVSMDTYLTLLNNKGSFNFTRTTINLKQSNLGRIVSADFDGDGDIDLAFNSLIIAGNRNKTPEIKLSSNSYNFKIVTPGTYRQTSFNIYNDGAEQTLELGEIKSSGSSFIAEPASGSIKPGDSLKVLVTFKPNGSADYSDSIMIFSNDISDSVKKFFVSGFGSQILSVYPSQYSIHPHDTTAIEIKFGLPPDVSTLNESNIRITGSYSGNHKIAQVNYNESDSTLILIPELPFKKGESVCVNLTGSIKTISQQLFRPYTWEFKIQPKMSSSIFRQKKSLSVPDGSTMSHPKDLDNDGDLDLIILARETGKILIYKNDENWNFVNPVILDGGLGPSTVLTGDYDNDGYNDIVVTNLNSRLIFYKNNGNMTFSKILLSNVNGYIEYLTQGDYDGDGYLDFIAASSSSDLKFNLIRNKGNFDLVVDSTFTGYGGRYNSADLDIDGDIDIFAYLLFTNEGNFTFNRDIYLTQSDKHLVFNPDNDNDPDLLMYSSVLRNDGELKFKFINPFPYNSSITGSVVNDFDGDGREDVCFFTSEKFMIYKNSGEMKFDLIANEKSPSYIWHVSSADLDSDGDNDLIFMDPESDVITLYENRDHFSGIALNSAMHNFGPVPVDSSKSVSFYISNNGTLPLETDTLISSNSAFSVTPAKGIIQPHDSLQITVTFSPDEIKIYSDSISIHSNDIEQPVVLFYVKGRALQKIIASTFPLQNDLNVISDTITITFQEDVNAATLNENTIKVSGSKTGSHSCSYNYEGHTKSLWVLPYGEFAAGELVSVIITNQIELMSTVPVLASYNWSFTRGAKEGSAKFKKIPNIVVSGFPNYISNGDLNNDGLSDLIVSNEQANKVSIIISERGKGPGTIKVLDPGSVPSDIVCDDFNEDGKIDILVNCSNSFAVFQNTGDFNFIRNSFNHFSGINCITTGDYDGDGSIDIAGFSPNHKSVQIFLNKGSFKFDKINIPVDISSAGQILSADFDNDGDVDLILTTHTAQNFIILKNEEHLEFSPLLPPNVSAYVAAMTLADFNSDNRIDVAAQSPYSNSISILHNDGDFTFHTIPQPGIKFNPYEITSADFNADGDIDLAALNPNSNNGTVYLNDSTGFKIAFEFPRESGSYSMTTGDYNGDGSIDIAYVNPGADAVNCYLNSAFRNFLLSSYHYKFNEVKTGDTAAVNITIYNLGLDSVKIDSLCFVNKLFSSETAPFILAPGDSGLINIVFKPDSAYNCIDTLILYSNTNSFNTIIIEGRSVPLSGIDDKNELPEEYTLFQNFPNPFNPSTYIEYAVPFESRVRIVVYNSLGEVVKELFDSVVKPGYNKLLFDAGNLASGMYVYSLTAGSIDGSHDFRSSKKMLLIK